MRNRRFALVATSDDEEETPQKPPPAHSDEEQRRSQRKRKKIKLHDEDEEKEHELAEETERKKPKKDQASGSENDDAAADDDGEAADAKPIGDSVRVSGKGRKQRTHFEAFEYDGIRYDLVSLNFSLSLMKIWFYVVLFVQMIVEFSLSLKLRKLTFKWLELLIIF